MRKGIFGCGIMAVFLMLGGCSSSESRTTTCSYDQDGIYDEQLITSVDGKVTQLEERIEMDFGQFGATEEDMADITEDDLKVMFEEEVPQLGEDMDGIAVEYELEGTKGVIVLTVDFSKADSSILADLGVIDTDTSNISLDLSIKALEEEGYTCK